MKDDDTALTKRTTDEVGTGSEAGETWRPAEENERDVQRDETGIGRHNP